MRDRLIKGLKDAVSAWEFYLSMYLKIGEVPDMSCEEFLADRLLENGVIVGKKEGESDER